MGRHEEGEEKATSALIFGNYKLFCVAGISVGYLSYQLTGWRVLPLAICPPKWRNFQCCLMGTVSTEGR